MTHFVKELTVFTAEEIEPVVDAVLSEAAIVDDVRRALLIDNTSRFVTDLDELRQKVAARLLSYPANDIRVCAGGLVVEYWRPHE